MTLVSEIITDAYRMSNLIALGQSPNTNQQTEALRYLNRIVKSVFGNEVGEKLEAFPVGSHNVSRPAGFPWWDNDAFVFPPNSRLILNLDDNEHLDLYLPPNPTIGCRFAYNFMDPGNGQTVTVFGNGRYIENADSISLDGSVVEAEYLYRDDLANWVKYAPLDVIDTFPFPLEFDTFFIAMLAMAINPSYGQMIDPQSQAVYKRAAQQIRARYAQNIQISPELALLRPARVAADRDFWGTLSSLYDSTNLFNIGWPW